nr:MAG TPA: hypothetical protein [Bacteriophage sp.]
MYTVLLRVHGNSPFSYVAFIYCDLTLVSFLSTLFLNPSFS